MNLGQKNNIHNSLSREEITRYSSTASEAEKHAIEEKAESSEFDSDALEGWSMPQMTGQSLKRLDKKFMRNRPFIKYSIGILSLGVMVVFLIVYLNKESDKMVSVQTTEKSKTLTYEPSDLLLPEDIEAMIELPKKEQISANTIRKDEVALKKEETFVPQSNIENLSQLPVKELEQSNELNQPLRETLFGKEIYLNSLKVLDYRAYRSKPTIQTKQIELGGTPANLSQSGTSQEEDPIWRTVDIPYIDYLEKTMDIFSKGNNKKAMARFEEILKSYPDDINSLFYGGLCYYNLREYSSAIASFQNCLDSKFTNFNEEAKWYLAKSLLADGQKEKARALFREIEKANGYYASQAKKILSTI